MCMCVPKPAKLIVTELRCWNFKAYSLCLISLDDITGFVCLVFKHNIFVLATSSL